MDVETRDNFEVVDMKAMTCRYLDHLRKQDWSAFSIFTIARNRMLRDGIPGVGFYRFYI
jgi:ribosomal protein L10